MSQTTAEPPPTTDAPPRAVRDARGRFARGNLGGPGNPFARKMAAFRNAIHAAITTEHVQAIIAAMLGQALAGNVAAAKLLLDHAAGKPTPGPDPDRLDVEEWKLLTEKASVDAQDADQVLKGFTVEAAVQSGRVAVYYNTTVQTASWLTGLGHPDQAAAHVEERLGTYVAPPAPEPTDDSASEDELDAEEVADGPPAETPRPAGHPSPSRTGSNGPATDPVDFDPDEEDELAGDPEDEFASYLEVLQSGGWDGTAPPSRNGSIGPAPPSRNGSISQIGPPG